MNLKNLRYQLSCRALFALFVAVFAVCTVWAQDAPQRTDLDRTLKTATSSASASDADKQQAKVAFDLAVDSLSSASLFAERAKQVEASYSDMLAKADAQTTELSQLPLAFSETETSSGLTSAQQIDIARKTSDELASAQRKISRNDELIAEIPRRTEVLQKRVAEIQSEKHAVTEVGDVAEANTTITQLLVGAQLAMLTAEESQLQWELKEAAQSKINLTNQNLLLKRQVSYLDKKSAYYQRYVMAMERSEVGKNLQTAIQIEDEIVGQWPELRQVSATNRSFYDAIADKNSALVQLREYAVDAKRMSDLLRSTQQYTALLAERRKSAVNDYSAGMRLVEQYKRLPSARKLADEWAQAKKDLSSAQYMLLMLDEEAVALQDMDLTARSLCDDLLARKDVQTSAEVLMQQLLRLLYQRNVAVTALYGDYNTLVPMLKVLNEQYQQFNTMLVQLRKDLSEELFWTHSNSAVSFGTFASAGRGLATLASPQRWGVFVNQLGANYPATYKLSLLTITLLLTLFYILPRIKRRIQKIVPDGVAMGDIPLRLSIKAMLYTCVVPLLVAAIFYNMSVRMHAVAIDPEDILASHLCATLQAAVTLSWTFLLIYYMCIPGGMGIRHLGWNPDKCKYVAAIVLNTYFTMLTIRFLFGSYLPVSDLQLSPEYDFDILDTGVAALNRLSNIVIFAVFCRLMWVLFDPRKGIMSGKFDNIIALDVRSSQLFAFRALQVFVVSIAVASTILLILGYDVAAVAINDLLTAAFLLLTLTVVVHSFVHKWLSTSQQRVLDLILRHVTFGQQADVASLEKEQIEKTGEATITDMRFVDEDDESAHFLYLRQLYMRTTRLSGIVIWGASLLFLMHYSLRCAPALDHFGKIELWSTKAADADKAPPATKSSTLAGGMLGGVALLPTKPADTSSTATAVALAQASLRTAPDEVKDSYRAVTVYGFIWAMILLFGAFLFAKNVKLLLELVLQQTPISPSRRYGICAITGYAVAILGIILSLSALGVTWGSVQWIIAAATVGLGFGLQEVFANLVSGLIILVEQPIRVGDTVTINGVTGKVTNISMRCTIVRDFDLRELIVPNKQIITGSVINASLSSNIVRETLELICQRQESDSHELIERITQAAMATHGVQLEPPPVTLLSSIAKARKFTLLYYIDSKQHTLSVVRSRVYAKVREELKDLLY